MVAAVRLYRTMLLLIPNRRIDTDRFVAGHAGRWASRQNRGFSLSARVFAESNRVLSAAAESVCVTSLPALISSQYWCA